MASAPANTANPSIASGNSDHKYIWSISLSAALGGLLFGYDWVVIGGAKPFYEAFFHITRPSEQGWVMSCALVGCLIGACVSGLLSERFGLKRTLIFTAVVFTVSSLGTGLAHTIDTFVLWRIIGGVAIGLASSLSPIYISELAPAQIRGELVAANQLTIVIGIVLAQVTNSIISKRLPEHARITDIFLSWDGQVGWRYMFGATAGPAMLFFVAMLLVPESPRWLANRGRSVDALRILTRVGGASYGEETLAEIRKRLGSRHTRSRLQDFLIPRYLKPLLLGVALAVLQQWCGINVVFNYAQEVFTGAGYSLSAMPIDVVVTGLIMMIFTFAAIHTVDRIGRRLLMLVGCAGLALTYLCLGYAYYRHVHGIVILLLIVAAIALYSMTLAPMTWVLLSEIFPNRIRAESMAIATGSLWSACFVLTYSFPLLNRGLGTAGTFWIYAAICAIGFMLISRCLPETKGKTLEQIESCWR